MSNSPSSSANSRNESLTGHSEDIWREKYLSSLDEIEQREESNQAAIDVLKRGILSVSLAGEGLDSDLDMLLHNLRREIKNIQSNSRVSELNQQIESRLIQLDTELSATLQEQLSSFSTSLSILHKSSLDPDTKKKLRAFQKKITASEKNQADDRNLQTEMASLLLPILNKLATAFTEDNPPQGLWNRLTNSIGNTPASIRDKSSDINALYHPTPLPEIEQNKNSATQDREAQTEFKLLASTKEFSSKLIATEYENSALNNTAKQLSEDISAADAELLSKSFPKILNLTNLAKTQQQKAFLDYLTEIASTLNKIKTRVKQSQTSQKQIQKDEQLRSRKLRGNLQKIRNILDTATDLDEIKNQTQDQLDELLLSLENSDTDLNQHHTALSSSLETQSNDVSIEARSTSRYIKDVSSSISNSEKHSSEDQEDNDITAKLKNRDWFVKQLTSEVNSPQNHNLCICLIQVISLQSINDSYGAKAANRALDLLTKEIEGRILDIESVAYGQEGQFLILMPDTVFTEGVARTEKLVSELQQLPFRFKEDEVSVALSKHVEQHQKNDSAESILRRLEQSFLEKDNHS